MHHLRGKVGLCPALQDQEQRHIRCRQCLLQGACMSTSAEEECLRTWMAQGSIVVSKITSVRRTASHAGRGLVGGQICSTLILAAAGG